MAMEEGFSQGYSLSPIFAAFDIAERASARVHKSRAMVDNCGGMPIIMSYVDEDDTNALVPLEDAEEFIRLFNLYGNSLPSLT